MFIILAACPMQAAKTDVNQLTLEEKIGQMMQLVTDLFGTNDAQGVFHIDYAKADTLFRSNCGTMSLLQSLLVMRIA